MKTNTSKVFDPCLFDEFISERYALTGLTVHRGVIVCLHEHGDDRIFGVIDLLPCCVADKIVAAIARKGWIALIWQGEVPPEYQEGHCVMAEDGDHWIITRSISA